MSNRQKPKASSKVELRIMADLWHKFERECLAEHNLPLSMRVSLLVAFYTGAFMLFDYMVKTSRLAPENTAHMDKIIDKIADELSNYKFATLEIMEEMTKNANRDRH